MHRFLCAILLLVVLSAGSFSAVEEPQPPAFSDEAGVTIVNLYASVLDQKGRPVYGLKQSDFNLFVNGKKKVITNFSSDIMMPLNIVFLLDVSGSMRLLGKFDAAKDIIREICQLLGPED